MEDFTTLWAKRVLNNDTISDDFKLKFFSELFLTDLNEDTVEHSFKVWRNNNIKSSNVKKLSYNDESLELVVQFNDKSIYTYYNIPFEIYRKISTGDYAPRTSGENEYGKWERGVKPSTGAGIWQALIDMGVEYKRGGSLK